MIKWMERSTQSRYAIMGGAHDGTEDDDRGELEDGVHDRYEDMN